MPSLNIPGWAMTTATAAIAFGAGLWTSARFVAEVEQTANTAHRGVVTLEPRVTAIEIQAAANGEKFAALMRQLDALSVRQSEAAADIKTLLARVPPK